MKISFYTLISGVAHALLGTALFLLVPFSMAVSSCDLTIKPLENGNDSENDGENDEDGQQEQIQKVLITFSGETFTVPLVYGPDFSEGKILWGDDSEDVYKEGASHDYSAGGEYVVTLEVPDAETIELQNISGISVIDLSGF